MKKKKKKENHVAKEYIFASLTCVASPSRYADPGGLLACNTLCCNLGRGLAGSVAVQAVVVPAGSVWAGLCI